MAERVSVDERRRRLVEAAFTVMARDGVAAATTRTICSEAGMPQSAFHYAFRSKSELMQLLTASTVSDMTTDLRVSTSTAPDLRSALMTAVDAIFASVTQDPGRQAVVYELTLLDLRASENPGSLGRWQYQLYSERAEEILTDLAHHHAIRWTVPVAALGRMVAVAVDGTVLAWLADRDVDTARAALSTMVDAFVALSVAA